ncbi:MAG: hypothetical protein K2X03_19305 [Bryobacteraceae bacterium]|nr:hypothetical protein [Bryobacteraceae bacterium]
MCLSRHSKYSTELPSAFKDLDLSQAAVCFVLVINGHKEEWLPPLQEALQKKLRPKTLAWDLKPPAVAVLNEQLAQKYGLIA